MKSCPVSSMSAHSLNDHPEIEHTTAAAAATFEAIFAS